MHGQSEARTRDFQHGTDPVSTLQQTEPRVLTWVSVHVSQPLSCYGHTYSTAFILLKQQETIREINVLSKTKTIVSPQTKLEISYQYFSFSQNSFIVERSLISSNDLSTETIPFSDFSSMNDTLSNLFKVI